MDDARRGWSALPEILRMAPHQVLGSYRMLLAWEARRGKASQPWQLLLRYRCPAKVMG